MKLKLYNIPFEKDKDDIYLIPTIAIASAKNSKNTAYGIGIKFLKYTFAISVLNIEPSKDK